MKVKFFDSEGCEYNKFYDPRGIIKSLAEYEAKLATCLPSERPTNILSYLRFRYGKKVNERS